MASRYLVVANQTLGGRHLVETVAYHASEGAAIHVTVPATPTGQSADAHEAGRRLAAERLGEELRRLANAGVKATGNVGPEDAVEAVREQTRTGHWDGVVISTLPRTVSRWFRVDLPHRVVRELGLSVEWLEARDDSDEPSIVHISLPRRVTKNLEPNIPRQIRPMRTR